MNGPWNRTWGAQPAKWVDTIPLKPARPIRKPYVQPAANDPGIGQGRPNHNPQRDRDILITIALTVGGWAVPVVLLWVASTYGTQLVATVLGWLA